MDSKKLAKIFKILSKLSNVKILRALQGCKKCVTSLELELNIKQSNLSQHLNYLKNFDILDYERKGNKNCYYIKDKRYVKLIGYLIKNFEEVNNEK